MSASNELRLSCAEDWEAATNHRFCKELAAGSLPREKMVQYLIQDYTFIDAFVRLAASAIAHAPSLADSIPLAQFLAVITGPENTYFLRSFEALGVDEAARTDPELWTATNEFQALMREAAASGRYEEMMAVLVVAEWIYLSWATPVNPPEDDLPFYFAEWITLHAGPGFEGVVHYLRDQLDTLWPSLDGTQKTRVEIAFRRAVALEKLFFDTAYSV